MQNKPITFVSIAVFDNWRFWRQFGDDYEAAGREVMLEAEELLAGKPEKSKRAAELLNAAADFSKKRRLAAQKANESKKQKASKNNLAEEIFCEATVESVYDFSNNHHLDTSDARDWYEMTFVDRKGLDRNGNRIKNWQGACKRFCEARAKKRAAENENP